MQWPQLSHGAQNAMVLSTLAGLSTGIGGLLAIVKKPDQKLLAALLGVAIGVMGSLSLLELLIRNALDHGIFAVSFSMTLGLATYHLLQPYLPDFDKSLQTANQDQGKRVSVQDEHGHVASYEGDSDPAARPSSGQQSSTATQTPSGERRSMPGQVQSRTADLLRLGLLMAVTMTLHNLPEGFAVAFSSFTDFGPYMAVAIAMHNIPEGIIVAAPVFASTGSRWKALGIALASGLSEPLGAAIALVAVKPFVSEEPLHYILAFVGGIMLAVCYLELWPEARKCKEDRRLLQGCIAGSLIMIATLAAGT